MSLPRCGRTPQGDLTPHTGACALCHWPHPDGGLEAHEGHLLCPYCHAAHHLDWLSGTGRGHLIFFPERPQSDLSSLWFWKDRLSTVPEDTLTVDRRRTLQYLRKLSQTGRDLWLAHCGLKALPPEGRPRHSVGRLTVDDPMVLRSGGLLLPVFKGQPVDEARYTLTPASFSPFTHPFLRVSLSLN
jgi:hypothetical protein